MRKKLTTLLVAGVAALALSLTGCASDPLAQQYREGSNKNYIAGDGSITEITLENRGDAITFSGTTESGEKVSSADYLGNVLVVNFWYAGCAPCRAEAPDLEKVYTETSPQGVNFLGVNVRDQAATVDTFNSRFGITYQSIIDQDGQAQLAFAAQVPPNAVPTTLILDAQGRVAARILGQLKDPSILSTLIADTAAESSAQ
ncbi:peroxiredoxin [Aurantimicrobium minutum]|uniref:TlpA disulfide reductase family protein n=1 Tax=Aurantimicrobium minutum TaxID=708131 RepID=UPI002474BCCE|nr:TlpA disulfide reductase family protein [Aurantimicrobium minutum]MDH6409761.1 peroxiredoxin [Aurantimicrobium minutum]MDH6423968.1 peroxiredoxin [Aurantimicrobium minutum]